VAVFIGVGEWRGWYLGVPGSTPVVVYKMDHRAVSTPHGHADRHADRHGGSGASGHGHGAGHPRAPRASRPGPSALPERVVFEQVYRAGQRIVLNQTFDEGGGVYRLRVTYADASGTFTFRLPPSSQL
jgi:hypothetical protein